MNRSKPLTRKAPLKTARKPMARGSGMAASKAQRDRVRDRASIVSGQSPCDASHLWPRSMGGCSDPLCVIALTREEHRAFDLGELDVLPYLIAHGMTAEIAHALEHARCDLIAVLERVTGTKWEPQP